MMGLSWDRAGQAVRPFVPFTALNTVWRHWMETRLLCWMWALAEAAPWRF